MPFPFGKSQKSPAEIVRSLREHVAYMEKLDAADSKKCEKVSNGVSSVCLIFKNCLLHSTSTDGCSHYLFFYTQRLQRRCPKI